MDTNIIDYRGLAEEIAILKESYEITGDLDGLEDKMREAIISSGILGEVS